MEALQIVLSRAFRRLGLERERLGWQAVEQWAGIVGPRVSRHTRAVGFERGTLRVEVEGSAWLHELAFLKRDLIRKINGQLGQDLVRDVRLIMASGGIRR